MTMDRKDISALGIQRLEELIAHPPQEAWRVGVRMSSGTTGTPIITVSEYGPLQFNKFSDSSRIVQCISLSTRLACVLHVRNGTVRKPQQILSVDRSDLSEELSTLIEDFSPDAIWGHTAFAVAFALCVSDKSLQHVQIVRCSGERLTPYVERIIRDRFPNAVLLMQYGSNETGNISDEGCPYLPANHYHPAPGVSVEIVNPDATGAGDMLISRKDTSVSGGVPFQDYRIGDTARRVLFVCRCGNPYTFEHLGRDGHDYLKIAGALVRREEFDRVAELFRHDIDDYRVEADEIVDGGELKGRILLRVYRKHSDGKAPEEIAREFSREVFLTQTKTLDTLVDEGVFLELAVEIADVPFVQKIKDVKLKRRS